CRGGFYAWRKREKGIKSVRQLQNERLTEQIRTAHKASKETYGSPRIFAELKEAGARCSEKRIARLMRLAGIRAVAPKRFVATTDSSHNLPIAENLLERTFEAETPNTRWTADITYIWTSQGWLYLAVILDLFSRRIVGWAMDRTIGRSLVLSALDMAIARRRPIPNSKDVLHAKDALHALDVLCHSDRGNQYASDDYQKR